jgi:hypothetical protein
VYLQLFGCEPKSVFPYHCFSSEPDVRFFIDVFFYELEIDENEQSVYVGITNGMSDCRRQAESALIRPI